MDVCLLTVRESKTATVDGTIQDKSVEMCRKDVYCEIGFAILCD
jgi:hypothetical protein